MNETLICNTWKLGKRAVLGTGPYLRQELSTGPGFPQHPPSTSVHTLYPEYNRKILPVLQVHLILCNANLILINIYIL
jgi:hypothetical protein